MKTNCIRYENVILYLARNIIKHGTVYCQQVPTRKLSKLSMGMFWMCNMPRRDVLKIGLLLGNGINMRLGITDLNTNEVASRFERIMKECIKPLCKEFEIDYSDDFVVDISCNNGIEHLVGEVYEYIKAKKPGIWIQNDNIKLLDLMTAIGFVSIFFDEKGLINTTYNMDDIPSFEGYYRIYSVNYTEFWDTSDRCVHLHGRADLDKIKEEWDCLRCRNENVIKGLIGLTLPGIIFAPIQIIKADLDMVKGLYPSDNLYPDYGIYPNGGIKLYKELEEVDTIDVFGLSPYGDRKLIGVLNTMKKVRVYIYNMKNNNKDVKEWNNLLVCEHEFLDSSTFRGPDA